MPDKPKLKLDDFIGKIVSDPAQPQETLLLQGFLGASSEPDHTRVYADVMLESYVDVANTDIIHTEPLPKEQSPLGGAYVWVKKSADVFPAAAAGATKAKAKFLEGPIAAEGEATAAVESTGTAVPKPAVKTVPLIVCHPTILVQACPPPTLNLCSTRVLICHPSIICPTRPGICYVGTALQCRLPDPTIYEQQPEFQAQAQAQMAAQPEAFYPTAFCSVYCPRTVQFNCHIATPHCPQFVQQPAQGGFAAPMGMPQPVSKLVPHCPVTQAGCPSIGAACVSVVKAACPTPQCPTPQHHCPSVQSYECPTVNRYDCPSVAAYQCHTVHAYECPSVGNYQCPSKDNYLCPPSQIPVHCLPTPNIQHCPTPNMICPPQTRVCPSVMEVCPTTSPLFC